MPNRALAAAILAITAHRQIFGKAIFTIYERRRQFQRHASHHITEIKDPGRDWNLTSAPTTTNTQPPIRQDVLQQAREGLR
jgi:hypothetical protein